MRNLKLAAACGMSLLAAVSGVQAAPTYPVEKPELVYVPVQPCRAFDTRSTTPVAANAVRGFHITGSTQFPEQGGSAHGCGVPSYATAVSITIIAINEQATGYLTAFAYNAPRPSNVSLYYQPNATIGNTTTASIGTDGNISIFSNKQTDVAGDVIGYYAQQIEGMVAPGGSIYAGSTGIVSATNLSPGVYTVIVDRDVAHCTPVVTPYSGKGGYGAAYAFNGNTVTAYTWSINPETHLEAFVNYYFYLAVHC